ncbi:MAG: polyphosphate polymerase domain-containing protein [Candidatus Sericytochromatia bacterium]
MTNPSNGHPLDALTHIVSALNSGTGELYACRQERKLVLPAEAALALRATVAQRMALEQWVPGRRQSLIHSIYFDTEDFALYRRSLAGEGGLSVKLRLRAYGDAATPDRVDEMRFLEAKVSATSPTGQRVKQKARVTLADGDLAKVLGAGSGSRSFKPASRKRFWTPLLGMMEAHDVLPRLTVCYQREAYMDSQAQLRITFDEGYRATPLVGAASPIAAPDGRIGEARIVEIKFLDQMPTWLSDELVRLGLPLEGQSFSKYKTAVPLLYPHMDLRDVAV